jgi:uncharacterized protein (TIGR00369 family)
LGAYTLPIYAKRPRVGSGVGVEPVGGHQSAELVEGQQLRRSMTRFEPRDPDWESRVRRSFARQEFMEYLGVEIGHISPGETDLVLPFRRELMQQHDYFHGGATATIADSAAGYAALSLFPAGIGVLTAEFKINLLNPAIGDRIVAKGRVIKPGRTLTVSRSDVYATDNNRETHIATALVTLMSIDTLDD